MGMMQERVYQKPARNVDELKQRLIAAWSGIQQSVIDQAMISGEIVLMFLSKPKANTLNIYSDVFIHNCEFVWTFNACITVVMNRLTRCVSQGSVMTLIRGGG